MTIYTLASLTLLTSLATIPAYAASITLYDDAKCGGANVTLTASVDDLASVNFAAKASSYLIKDGKWAFYTGTAKTKSRLPRTVSDGLKASGACVDLKEPFDNAVNSVELAP